MERISELLQDILSRAGEENGRKTLSCRDAFLIAGKHQVDILSIGRICNEQRIKICRCQLGCFP